LTDRASEKPGRHRHDERGSNASSTRGLAEYGDLFRVAAERGDVVLHPPQRGDLVEDAPVGRCSDDVREAFHTDAVVHADHHHAAPGESRTVVVRVGGVVL
jgi:hypothetical protein